MEEPGEEYDVKLKRNQALLLVTVSLSIRRLYILKGYCWQT